MRVSCSIPYAATKSGSVAGVAFSPCGSYFATGGMDGQAMLWKADFQAGLLGSISDPARGPNLLGHAADAAASVGQVPWGWLLARPAPRKFLPSPSQDHAPLQSAGPCSKNLVDPSFMRTAKTHHSSAGCLECCLGAQWESLPPLQTQGGMHRC